MDSRVEIGLFIISVHWPILHYKFCVSGMAHTPSVDPQGRIVWVDLEVSCDFILVGFSFRIVFVLN